MKVLTLRVYVLTLLRAIINTAMKYLDIYKLLDKSNCRECGFPTCTAFVHAVINGNKKIGECTHLDRETAADLEKKIVVRDIEKEHEAALGPLKKEISMVDFGAVAERLGATLSGDRLCVKCLGKDFFVDRNGDIESLIHVHLWVTVPLLKYIITGGGAGLTGTWVSFDELKNGITMSNFRQKVCGAAEADGGLAHGYILRPARYLQRKAC